MKSVRTQSELAASDALIRCIEAAGETLDFPDRAVLFRAGDPNIGVFLVREGEVCLQMENLPHLDRFFIAGALLGLPATFTGNPYSLMAVCTTPSQLVRVAREDFLRLMQDKPELCREATDLLSRELRFIQSAVAQGMEKAAR
jgi:CRP-like cAMP-binding protein